MNIKSGSNNNNYNSTRISKLGVTTKQQHTIIKISSSTNKHSNNKYSNNTKQISKLITPATNTTTTPHTYQN